jgi:hypothetical protein
MKLLHAIQLSGVALALSFSVEAVEAVHFESPGLTQWYVTPDQTTTVTLRLKSGSAPEQLDCSLLDYGGSKTGSVTLTRLPDSKQYQGTLQLSRGFHELELPLSGQRFGIVALKPFSGTPDPFFRIQSDLYSHANKTRLDSYRVFHRAGIRNIREFHGWDREEPKEGQWDPRYDQVYRDAEKTGLKVLSYLSYPPAWIGGQPNEGKSGWQPYPLDLLKMSVSMKTRFQNRKAAMDGFQVDNEMELKALPANEYIPMLAATSWYMAQNEVDVPLVGGAIAYHSKSHAFFQDCIENGFLEFVDVVAFHHYRSPEEMEQHIRTRRDQMKNSAKHGLPIWITECGKAWDRGIHAKSVWDGPPGAHRAKVGEDLLSACWISMLGVEAKACGVAGFYPYRYLFRPEKNSNFGMIDYYQTPMRSLAAYFFSIQLLSGKHYIGDLKLAGEYSRKRLFSDGKETVAVLYSGKTGTIAYHPGSLPVQNAYGADGRSLARAKDGSYHIPDGMIYLVLKPGELSASLVNTQTQAARLRELADSYRPVPRKISPLIYRSALYEEHRKNTLSYLFTPKAIEVDLFNLSGKPQTTEPELILPEGMQTASGPAKRSFTLPPYSCTRMTWNYTGESRLPYFAVKVIDRAGAAVPLTMKFLNLRKQNSQTFELNSAVRWKENCAGKMTIRQDPAENAIHVHTDFTDAKGDWSYPEYRLNLPNESLEHAYAVSFEIKAKHPDGNPYFPYSYFQISREKKGYEQFSYKRPTAKWEERVVLLPAGKLKDVSKVRIGMGSREKVFDFWIRNIRIYFQQ